jgi:anhydro-N-acetylmuramic acid kinase
MPDLYIGLMSGTSLDGVDGVLVDFDPAAANRLQVLAHAHRPFDAQLRSELLALNGNTDDELARGARAANALAQLYAQVVAALLTATQRARRDVRAVGAHGQTVRHQPPTIDTNDGYTIQLNNPALLAELCGIDVVADFRSRDMAAGGQGAPLVPAFHRAYFSRPGEVVAVLNLGGFGNLTVLAESTTLGFDCGPANALMDYWCERHTGQLYDVDGHWAAGGHVIAPLLDAMLAAPYFALSPPKSTGRDLFNPAWLAPLLASHARGAAPQDVQTTLAELTAVSVAHAVQAHAARAAELLVCGGGAHNAHLLRRIAALLAPLCVQSTAARGLQPTQVEATAFAWLARQFVLRQPGNLSTVTGAAGPRVLGALYPAG